MTSGSVIPINRDIKTDQSDLTGAKSENKEKSFPRRGWILYREE